MHQEAADIKQKRDELEKSINAPVPADILEGWTARIREIVQSQVSAKVEHEVKKNNSLISFDNTFLRTNTSSANKSRKQPGFKRGIIRIGWKSFKTICTTSGYRLLH